MVDESRIRDVEAVVLNWHDAPRTNDCCEALSHCHQIHTITVVDNESSGESIEPRLGPPVRLQVVRLGENRGFAGGINKGLLRIDEQATRYVLVINNDAQIRPSALELLIQRMDADPHLGACSPRIEFPDGQLQTLGGKINRVTGRVTQLPRSVFGCTPWPHRVDYLSWACVLIRREALTSVGLLDERFFLYWEDVDFSLRLRECGWTIDVESAALAYHELSASATRAGLRLVSYYAWGLVELGRKRTISWRVRSCLLLLLLLAKRLAAADIGGSVALARGVRCGLRTGNGPAYTRNSLL